MKKLCAVLCLALLVGAGVYAQQNNPPKYALVIGNGNYTGISKLNNPVNDANDMDAALRALGFTVEKVLNGTLDQMENAVMNLQRRLSSSPSSYGFFFYAGHGVQSNGDNYLIPVDANIQTENHLRQRAVSVQTILDNLTDAGNALNMIVLDACRDNPFSWARSGSRGLSVVGRAPPGSIIMYATSVNSTAADGTGRNGLFTAQLLNNLKTPGLSVRDMFDKTGEDTLRVSGGQQHPELSVRFFGASSAYLGTRPTTTPTTPPQQITPAVTPAAPPQQPAPANMVRISGGTFTMGSPANEPNRQSNETQHQVTVSAFYMGKYEVTQREYQAVMGTNPSRFKGDNLPVENVTWFDAVNYCNRLSQREGLTPAYTINGADVTWNRNANGYRLPTEAEWEYACRAGTTTAYNTGVSMGYDTGWYNANSVNTTHPVGQKLANRWGLHDMHGNVFEWCWDRHGAYSSGSQTDPTGASSSGYNRVVRGGSWVNSAQDVRSARRGNGTPQYQSGNFIGFRVVRS